MGSFRFRRSVKIAPGIRLNFNKKSIGLSAGVPGARISKNSNGRGTRSVGIPVTGLYWRDQSGPRRTQSARTAPEPHDPGLSDAERHTAEARQALLDKINAVSIEVPTSDGEGVTLYAHMTPETLALIEDEAEQRVVWEGGSPEAHWLAGDPKYADWTTAQVARATIDQTVRLQREVRRRIIIHSVTRNAEVIAEFGEDHAAQAGERLADAVDAATGSGDASG